MYCESIAGFKYTCNKSRGVILNDFPKVSVAPLADHFHDSNSWSAHIINYMLLSKTIAHLGPMYRDKKSLSRMPS